MKNNKINMVHTNMHAHTNTHIHTHTYAPTHTHPHTHTDIDGNYLFYITTN